MLRITATATTETRELLNKLVESKELAPVEFTGSLYAYVVPLQVRFGNRKNSKKWVVIKTGRADPGNVERRLQAEYQAYRDHSGLTLEDPICQIPADISLEKSFRESLGYVIGAAFKVKRWNKFLFNDTRENFSVGPKEFVLTTGERVEFLKGFTSDVYEMLEQLPELPRPPTGKVRVINGAKELVVSDGLESALFSQMLMVI